MKKLGRQTFEVENECFIVGRASVVGKKEKQGIYGDYFDQVVDDDKMGEKTFEKGERKNYVSIQYCKEGRIEQQINDEFFYLMPGDCSFAIHGKQQKMFHQL